MDEPAPTRVRRPRGPRADGGRAREEIVAAAAVEFAERGYDAVSVRGVARRADVDPGLVRYYFPGGKGELFAVAVGDRAVDPGRMVAEVLAAGPEGLGERIVLVVLGAWDEPGGRERFRVLMAGTASGQHRLVHDFLIRELLTPLASALAGPDVPLRIGLVAAQLSGLLMARHVLEIPAVARAPVQELAHRVGPTIDSCLQPLRSDPVGSGDGSPGS